jgi:23S rRNA (guanine1835-N2)-methyltransferase
VSPELSIEARVSTGRATYEFKTVDGVHSPDSFRDAELQLLDALWERHPGTHLVVQANYGVLGTILAARSDSVQMTETSARATRLCRENVDRNDVEAEISLVTSPAAVSGQFDTGSYAPAGYTPIALGKQRLVDALSVLRPGGTLFVAGRTETGLNRYESCLETHCRAVETVHESDTGRVIAGTRPAEFTPPNYVSTQTIETTVDGVDLSLRSVPGLFSADSLDHGTRHLIETATVEDGERVLDLACGYGPVGTYAASVADADVVLADDNARATRCVELTLEATGVEGTVVTGDGTRGIEGQFDRVLSNPPTHAGSGVLSDMFTDVADVLADGGELSVVHHEELDLDSYLRTVGTVVDRNAGGEHVVVTVRR